MEDLRKSKAGQYYEQALVQQRAELDALPDALTGRVPLAANLKIADADHDGYGAVIFFITQAALRSPDTPELMRAAAIRVAEAFVPALAQLQDPYVVEAHRAAERRPLLETMKADLEMFPVRQGVTLLQVATNFLDAGDTLNSLLDQRGDIPKADRSKAAAIRAKSVGLLNRLRADLRDEVANTPSVPRDLEQRVFGYLDTIAAMTKPARSGKEGPPAPATT
ncbi:MAG: hypothetical protein MUF54_24780 [Polyangiaceae bacterium]|nr:hypothetical protein [Polyangiaceae bacterium]